MAVQKRRYFVKNIPPSSEECDVASYFKRLGKITEVSIGSNAQGKFSFFTVEALAHKLEKAAQKYGTKDWNNYTITLEPAKESFMTRLKREQAESAKVANVVSKVKQNDVAKLVNGTEYNVKKVSPVSKEKKRARERDSEEPAQKKLKQSHASNGNKRPAVKKTKESESEDDVSVKLGIKKFTGTQQLYHTGQKEKATKDEDGSEVMSSLAAFDSMWEDNDTGETSTLFNSFIGKQKALIGTKVEKKSKSKVKEKTGGVHEAPMTKIEKKRRDDERRKQSLSERAMVIRNQQKLINSSLSSAGGQKNNKIVFDVEDEMSSSITVKKALFDDEDDAPFELPTGSEREHEKKHKLMQLQSKFISDERFKLDERFLDDESAEERESLQWKKKEKEMVRYDPEKSCPLEAQSNSSTKKSKQATLREAPVVSKEKFYEVSENMKHALSEKTPGFSLLAAYGDSSSRERGGSADIYEAQARPIRKKNPLLEDSSDEEIQEKEEEQTKKWAPTVHLPPGPRDNFFFAPEDPLFAEAFNFINKKNSEEANAAFEKYDDTRRELKKIIKDQVQKRTKKAAMFRNKVVAMKKKTIVAPVKRTFPVGKQRNNVNR